MHSLSFRCSSLFLRVILHDLGSHNRPFLIIRQSADAYEEAYGITNLFRQFRTRSKELADRSTSVVDVISRPAEESARVRGAGIKKTNAVQGIPSSSSQYSIMVAYLSARAI